MRARDVVVPPILGMIVAALFVFLWPRSPSTPSPQPGPTPVGTKARVAATQALIANLETAIAVFESQYGDYPPSSLARLVQFRDSSGSRPFAGFMVPTDPTNTGVECLYLALRHTKGAAGAWSEEDIGNVDNDPTTGSTPAHAGPASEFIDGWGNPLVYVHHRDYGKTLTVRLATGVSTTATAQKSSGQRSEWQRRRSYQLYSLGPDGQPGTADDVRNW